MGGRFSRNRVATVNTLWISPGKTWTRGALPGLAHQHDRRGWLVGACSVLHGDGEGLRFDTSGHLLPPLLHFAQYLPTRALRQRAANGREDHLFFHLQVRAEYFLQRFRDGAHFAANFSQGVGIVSYQYQQGQQTLDQLIDCLMLLAHDQQGVADRLGGNSTQTRLQGLVLIGLVQRQREAVVPVNGRRSLSDLFGGRAVGMRQLDGHAGEVTNTLMAADQQIDGVFGGLRLRGSKRRNLIQHATLLSRRKKRQGLGIRGWDKAEPGGATKSDKRKDRKSVV